MIACFLTARRTFELPVNLASVFHSSGGIAKVGGISLECASRVALGVFKTKAPVPAISLERRLRRRDEGRIKMGREQREEKLHS